MTGGVKEVKGENKNFLGFQDQNNIQPGWNKCKLCFAEHMGIPWNGMA